MFTRLGPALVMLTATATSAWAQSCGSPPIAPAFASAVEMRQKSAADATAAKHEAFVEIKDWQSDLKTYRACLTNVANEDRRQIPGLDPAKDADKIADLQRQAGSATHQYDATVDMEERVVNEFHALQTAYCGRTDIDKASCPK